MMERTLFEYGVWLEENVWSKSWKEDFRRAAILCIDHRLYLHLAKQQPLAWWEENGVKEGIAKAFLKYTRHFNLAKEKGWVVPQSGDSDDPEQQFHEWYEGLRGQ